MNYKRIIAEMLFSIIDVDMLTLENLIHIPPNREMGDYTISSVDLMQYLNMKPNLISKELMDKLEKKEMFTVVNKGVYINFYVNNKIFNDNILNNINKKCNKYGQSTKGAEKNVSIECFQGGNKNKYTIEDIYSIILANSLYKIYHSQGYIVSGYIHIDNLKDKFFNAISIGGRSVNMYDELEDNITSKIESCILKLSNRKLIEENEEIKFIKLNDYNLPPCVILKNGKPLKSLFYISNIIDKNDSCKIHKYINIYSNIHKLYGEKIFRALQKVNYQYINNYTHVGFGLIKIIGANIENNHMDIDDNCIIFQLLKSNRENSINIYRDKVVENKEESLVYIKEVYLKAQTVLNIKGTNYKYNKYNEFYSDDENELIELLGSFNNYILDSLNKMDPSIIATYVIELAQKYNSLYETWYRFEDKICNIKINISHAVCKVIKNSLNLLNITIDN